MLSGPSRIDVRESYLIFVRCVGLTHAVLNEAKRRRSDVRIGGAVASLAVSGRQNVAGFE